MSVVSLRNVSFTYPVFEITGRSLKASLMRSVGGDARAGNRGYVEVEALSDINLTIEKGDRVGLIGHNGSGKSTLLRLVGGIYHPTRGQLVTHGRVVPLLEKGIGIHHDLTGRENIEIPMRLLGATSEEVQYAKVDLPEWTGLGPYMDLPVRTYSEGMKSRLLFGLCTALSADVLALDEWLSAGDIDFAELAKQRLHSMLDRISVVILATHSLDLMRSLCNRVIWLDSGRIVMEGDPDSVLGLYEKAAHDRARKRLRIASQ